MVVSILICRLVRKSIMIFTLGTPGMNESISHPSTFTTMRWLWDVDIFRMVHGASFLSLLFFICDVLRRCRTSVSTRRECCTKNVALFFNDVFNPPPHFSETKNVLEKTFWRCK